jgi:hypothetical protein
VLGDAHSGVEAVGVDETAFLAANATHATVFVTGIVALPGPGRPSAQLLDVMPGRTNAVVQQWFFGLTRSGVSGSRCARSTRSVATRPR